MADVFSPNSGRGQPRLASLARSATLAVCLALGAAGCAADPLEIIGGEWIIDGAAWLDDPTLDTMRPADRQSLDALAGDMARATRFTFTHDRCVQAVMGRPHRWRCRALRVDRGVAVLQATDDQGTITFVRATPRPGGVWLEWNGRRLPLRRVGRVATK